MHQLALDNLNYSPNQNKKQKIKNHDHFKSSTIRQLCRNWQKKRRELYCGAKKTKRYNNYLYFLAISGAMTMNTNLSLLHSLDSPNSIISQHHALNYGNIVQTPSDNFCNTHMTFKFAGFLGHTCIQACDTTIQKYIKAILTNKIHNNYKTVNSEC